MLFKYGRKVLGHLILGIQIVLISACHSGQSQIIPFSGDLKQPKNIFVFLDGTSNDEDSHTNVWKTFEAISKNNDPQIAAIYIEGVGTAKDPLFGAGLGRGMEDRILRGYEFVTKDYRPGDNLYIFGFSRGAHQARALAGLISYAGIPTVTSKNESKLLTVANKILDMSKDELDENDVHQAAWQSWAPADQPILANDINKKLRETMIPVDIKFLGVWDTVPGSSFKGYGGCKENIGYWKTNFHWLPLISLGERYKTNSYPAIHFIAHAVSLDEQRSKFQPILLCKPINSGATKIEERWFPGAHADVGGGYEDSHALSDIALEWIQKKLAEHYVWNQTFPDTKDLEKGVAHWSMGDKPANFGSDCVDRTVPLGATVDPKVFDRQRAQPVEIIIQGEKVSKHYPLKCADMNSYF